MTFPIIDFISGVPYSDLFNYFFTIPFAALCVGLVPALVFKIATRS